MTYHGYITVGYLSSSDYAFSRVLHQSRGCASVLHYKQVHLRTGISTNTRVRKDQTYQSDSSSQASPKFSRLSQSIPTQPELWLCGTAPCCYSRSSSAPTDPIQRHVSVLLRIIIGNTRMTHLVRALDRAFPVPRFDMTRGHVRVYLLQYFIRFRLRSCSGVFRRWSHSWNIRPSHT